MSCKGSGERVPCRTVQPGLNLIPPKEDGLGETAYSPSENRKPEIVDAGDDRVRVPS